MQQRYVVIVDPFGTGQEYHAAFAEHGVEVVAVLSSAEVPGPYQASWHPEKYPHTHVFTGDAAALAATLRGYHPICLIPGSEIGVEVAEALVEMVVPGTLNVPESAPARRDKWAMAQALMAAGVPHPLQFCSDDRDDIDKWLHETGLHGRRFVIKPPKSAGTDNVHIVEPGQDWRPVFDQIYGRVNVVGLRNEAVLVEEFLDGTEYMIDSYSVDGVHGLVDVCRYTKSQRGDRIGIYDLVEFLPPDHDDVAVVWPYVQQVLDAVGVRNGCAHTEVIVTADGPRLLEIGARPAGGGHQMITELATGTNQIRRTIDHRVLGRFAPGYELQQFVCSVVISAPRAGIWRNAEVFADVESLPTYWRKWFGATTGDRVQETNDLYSYLGWVVLASVDEQAMRADYRQIKEWERQIQIEPTEPVMS